MRLRGRVARMFCLLAVFALPATAQQFWSRKTEFLDLVYYDKAQEPLTYHLTRSFENSLAFHRKLFNYTPSEPVVVFMHDFSDFGHGATSTMPFNSLSIGIEPFDYVYDTSPANERINWLMNHELAHVVGTEKGAGRDLVYRKLFHGKVVPSKEQPLSMIYSYLTIPRWYSPRWYHEGLAVFLETWMAGGVGRSLGGYDEMVFRTMALENAYFYDVVGLESEGTTADFQVGATSYLYGTRFMSWLAVTYGPEKLIEWTNRAEGTEAYFSSQFKKVYGSPLEVEWRKWIAHEKEWQAKNLAVIAKYPVTSYTPVVKAALGSVSRTFYDGERQLLYTAVNRPAKPAQIVSIDLRDGKIVPLREVFGASLYYVSSLAMDAKARKLFYTTKNTRGWRDLNELDLASGRQRIVLKDARIGDLVVNPADSSIWGVQHNNGFSSLVRVPAPHEGWQTLIRLDYGRDLFDLDISPDGKTLTGSIIDVTGRQQLVSWDIATLTGGDTRFELIHEFPDNSPSNFVFSPDGRHLYGTTYYTGTSNVFRYDFATKKMEALTNADTGFFRPLPISNDTMVAYRFTAQGFLPVKVPIAPIEDINAIEYLGQQIVKKFPVVKEWNAGSPARVDIDKVTTYAGPYREAALRLGSVYPVLEGYKDTVAAGVRFNVSDPFEINAVDITAAVSKGSGLDASERFHFKGVYDRYPWKLKLSLNPTDFYDLFGPTKTSRKGHSAVLTRQAVIWSERPRVLQYSVTGAYYGGLDTVPDYQNVRAPYDRYSRLSANLDYSDLRRTLGAVEEDRGMKWNLAGNASRVNGELFPRVWGTFDRGMLLPVERMSLWVRTAAGRSWGDRDNPFANFYFGGFGNNYVDYQEARRYNQYASFPGVEINEIGGNSFAKGTLELQLPPLKFRQMGVPGLYARWLRPYVFAQSLMTDFDGPNGRQHATSFGGQLNLSIVMFSSLEATVSAGYAVARHNGNSSDEVMLSLKLLR